MSKSSFYRQTICRYGLSLIFLVCCLPFSLAYNNTLNNLDSLFEIVQSNPQEVKQILATITPQDLASAPDSIKFNYHYLSVWVDNFLDIHSEDKLVHLLTAKNLCETSLGILSSNYLELVWTIGQEYIYQNDSISAFQIYRYGLIMSKGWYSLKDEDDAYLYNDMASFVQECYQSPDLRAQLIDSRFKNPTPIVEQLLDYPAEDEEFLIALNNDSDLLQALIEASEKGKLGDIKGSIADYEQILKRKNLDIITQASINLLLCIQYLDAERFKEAETLYFENKNNLENVERTNARVYRKSLSGLGNLYNAIHNYQEAERYCYDAKFFFEQNLDFGVGYIQCLSRYASSVLELDKNYVALLLIDTALDQYNLFSRILNFEKDYYFTLLNNASVIYSRMGFPDDGIHLAEATVQLAEKEGAISCIYMFNLGHSYFEYGLYENGLAILAKAYDLANRAYEKIRIGMDFIDAFYFLNHKIPSEITIEISATLRNEINRVFMFLSSEQRANYWQYFENYLPIFNFCLYQSLDSDTYGCIYDNIIYEKGLLLRTSNSIKNAIEASNNAQYISAYENMLLLRQQAFIEKDLSKRNEYINEANQLDKYLTTNVSEYDSFSKSNNINWKDIKDQLTDKDIAIEFYNIPIIYLSDTIQNMTGEPRYCAVILKKGYEEPQIIPLCKEAELGDDAQGDLYKTDYIYSLIWKPLEHELQGVDNIYFSADRELHKIAIEYALLPKGKRMNDVYNIYRLSSTRELVNSPTKPDTLQAVLYGGLNYDLSKDKLIAESRSSGYHTNTATRSADLPNLRYGVDYLPGTKEEVEKIGDLFTTAQIKHQTIMGDAGTEESFRSLNKEANIIHLATHGFFWTEEETDRRSYANFLGNINNQQRYEDKALLRSGLIFSGANIGLRGEELPADVEDGVLTAQELSAMNLGNVDLVVLSACESGLGETSREGVFGLQRGFKLAGANSLLMSLWKVDDEATQMLMTEFYSNLLAGQSKIESLRKAQEYVRNAQSKYEDPYYWAAFIIVDAID